MSDLKLDYEALKSSVTALGQLETEFNGIEGATDDVEDIWCDDDVKDAMHEFSHNMDYNRKKLTEKIKTIGQKMEDSLHAFEMVEADLVKALQSEDE